MTTVLSLGLVMTMVAGPRPLQAVPGAGEPDLQRGIKQVNDGELEAAMFTLDAVIRTLTPQGAARLKELAQAHLYKGVAYVGLLQEEPAKASFREALRHDRALRLAKGQFPDRVIRVFEAARKGQTKSAMQRPSDAPKKAGIGAAGIAAIVGGAVLLVGGAAAAVAAADPRDDDGDGVSVAQGDCNDADPRVRPGAGIDATMVFPWSGMTSCVPPDQRYVLNVTNFTCETIGITLTGEVTRPGSPLTTPTVTGTVPPGNGQAFTVPRFGLIDSVAGGGFICCGRVGAGVSCSPFSRIEDHQVTFQLATTAGNRTFTNSYRFDANTCQPCR